MISSAQDAVQRLVVARPVDTIDHQHLQRTGGRFEPESELLLEGSEERSPGILWSRRGSSGPIGTERELDVPRACQACAVNDRALKLPGEEKQKCGDGLADSRRESWTVATRTLRLCSDGGLRRAVELRSTKLRAEPPVAARENEFVDLHLPRFASYGQREPVFEERAKHQHLEVAGSWRCRWDRAGARHDVEPFDFGPARQADQVRALQVVGKEDQVARSDPASRPTPGRRLMNVDPGPDLFGRTEVTSNAIGAAGGDGF